MNRLPYEILKEIFILLPQHQKVECMCVCRYWEKCIENTCLFHTVLFNIHRDQDKLTRVFKYTPSNEKKVKRLILYGYYGYSRFNIISTPNLIHLTLSRYRFTYGDVEQFDQVYPLLRTIKFELFCSLDRNVPNKIKPNTRINYVHFKLRSISMIDQSTLLRYINKKYTNLISFVYDSGVPSCNQSLSKENQIINNGKLHHALISLITSQGPQLKKLKVLCNRFVFSQLQNSIMPFHLNELNLDLTLTFLGSLHIKNTLLESPFRQLHTLTVQFLTASSFEWLEALDKLAVLKIKYPRFQVVKIDSVVQHASETLKTLVIKGCSVGVERDECDLSTSEKPILDQDNIPDKTIPICSLRKIEMANVKIKENVDNFISISCPGLEVLSVYNCSIDNTKLRAFQLPHIHLLYFNITKSYNFYDPSQEKNWNYIRIHTKNNSQFYRIDHSQNIRYTKSSFSFRDYPVAANSSLPTTCHSFSMDIWNFTFASVEHVGIPDSA